MSRRKFVTTTVKGEGRRAPDLVDRNFTAEKPDVLWVADITYVPTWAGFLYLAVVLDACSRRIVPQFERKAFRKNMLRAIEAAQRADSKPLGAWIRTLYRHEVEWVAVELQVLLADLLEGKIKRRRGAPRKWPEQRRQDFSCVQSSARCRVPREDFPPALPIGGRLAGTREGDR